MGPSLEFSHSHVPPQNNLKITVHLWYQLFCTPVSQNPELNQNCTPLKILNIYIQGQLIFLFFTEETLYFVKGFHFLLQFVFVQKNDILR
jgi:hypothetical protein